MKIYNKFDFPYIIPLFTRVKYRHPDGHNLAYHEGSKYYSVNDPVLEARNKGSINPNNVIRINYYETTNKI